MEAIRAEVIRKRRLGIYPPEVSAEIDDVLVGRGLKGGEEALEKAISDAAAARFTALVETGSRRPIIGGAVSFTKRLFRRLLLWYMGAVVEQIRVFAFNVARVLRMLNERIITLEQRVEPLSTRVQELENSLRPIAERLESVEGARANERALERLARLDRAVRDLRERLDVKPTIAAHTQTAAPPATGKSREVERALDYFEFEDRFRGSLDEVRRKQAFYVELFQGSSGRVVDLGCGRGEFLSLLQEAGKEALGVDRHPDMVAYCKEQGFEAVEMDALAFLSSQDAQSLGGIFCSHMIEHLDPSQVTRFFELASDVLKLGGTLAVETPNPRSLFIFASAFYVDLGHLRPIHPLTLEFLAQATGFSETRIEYLSPVPEGFRPQRLDDGQELEPLLENINANFKRIDDVLFGPQDYALIAQR